MTTTGARVSAAAGATRDDIERIELDCLLEAIYRRYGWDFREYSPASLRRRVWRRVRREGLESVSALQERILREPTIMERLLLDLSINVTAMFRDPSFYLALREQIVPLLRTYPFTRIWNAGCSSGEEVYSLAIVLEEEGVYDRARIYATDLNENVLERGGVPAREDEGVHAELHPQRRHAVFLRLLHLRVRRSRLRQLAEAQHRLRAAQPRLGPIVQRVPSDRLPQRDDLLRQHAAEPRARALLREPGALRRARARAQGIHPPVAARGPLRGARRPGTDLPQGSLEM